MIAWWKTTMHAAVFGGLVMIAIAGRPALANETITYTYDALGRVTGVAHSGTVNNGTQVSYTLDAAGNRKNMTTTGAVYSVVVVPLRGFSVIPFVRR